MDTIDGPSLITQGDVEKARLFFYASGLDFFNCNSGKNTPNILLILAQQLGEVEKRLTAFNTSVSAAIQSLDKTTKAASDSSTRLATALNRITIAAVFIAILTLGWEIYRTFFLKD